MPSSFRINSKLVLYVLLSVWFVLWSANGIQDIMLATSYATDKIWMLDVDSEDSIYTWFSGLLLAFAAMIAFVLASCQREDGKTFAKQWAMMGGILLLMSMDEMLSFHEKLSSVLHGALSTSGLFAFAWVIPGIALVGAVAVLFWPFLRSLPFTIARGIFVAGAVFVMGALGLEMLAGLVVSGAGPEVYASPLYRGLAGIEEGLEGLGVILLIRTLLAQAALYVPAVFAARPPASVLRLTPQFQMSPGKRG